MIFQLIDKAYREGQRAARCGEPRTACPYANDKRRRLEWDKRAGWIRGWLAGHERAKR